MAEAVSDTIKESAHAAEVVAKTNVYPVVISAAALLFIGLLVWKLASVQIDVMQEMAKQIRSNARETQALHDAFVAAGIHVRRAEPAAARSETE